MKWVDINDIVIELADAHPQVDPTRINFVDLLTWVVALPDFDDDPKHCGEKVLEAIQQAWIDEQVPQCGFCQNGQIMTAKALLDKNPKATDAQIREGMARTLCRCMTYYRIQAAIKLAQKKILANGPAVAKEVVA